MFCVTGGAFPFTLHAAAGVIITGMTHPEGLLSGSVDAHSLSPDRNPWEKQPAETDTNYDWFKMFRDMRDRSLTRLSREAGVNHETIRSANRRWHWAYRAAQWDRYCDKQDLVDAARQRRIMNQAHRDVAREALKKVQKWLDGCDPTSWRPFEAAKWLEAAAKLEREATQVPQLGDGGAETSTGPAGRTEPSLADLAGLEPDNESEFAKTMHGLLEKLKQNG